MKIWLTIFLVPTLSHGIQSQLRLVENTTCLKLAKPSNQQFRLACSQYDYHCLLDETFTQEFEVCREWKWIPGGKCAYFNTYGKGNVDEGKCEPGINLTCSQTQFESRTNTQFTACYAKRHSTTSTPTRSSSPIQVTFNGTSSDTATSYSSSNVWIVFLLYIVAVLTIVVILFILRYLKLCRKDNSAKIQIIDEEKVGDGTNLTLMNSDNEEDNKHLKSVKTSAEESQSKYDTDKKQIEDKEKVAVDTSGFNVDRMELDNEEKDGDFHDALETLGQKEEEKSADSQQYSGFGPVTSGNKQENVEESTYIFDDTVESLQTITLRTDEQELCYELYSLLGTEGLNLTQDVMTATITKETGKSVETLLKNLSDQDKSKLKNVLHEESHRIIESKAEHGMSFHVSYGLLWIFLDEEKSPKSGWGNPVRGTDICIGDDVERLYRIQIIVCGISNPVTVSVESYIRLLDIMIKALIRLDPDAEFKKDYKLLSYKLKSINNPNLTQKMLKTITEIVKNIW